MSQIDVRFVASSELESFFVNKLNGLPNANGIVTFYKDSSRTSLKTIYQITGTPPNYTFTALPNPMTLSAVGTPQDQQGNDVAIYYFPYDGDATTSTNTVELYYVTVYDNAGNLQFTREGWPPSSFSNNIPSGSQSINNYIPNGQFRLHNNVNPNATIPGIVTDPSTNVGQGGWTFDRPSGTTSVDYVTFALLGLIGPPPSAYPRYGINIQNTTPNSLDNYKDLRVKFADVNKFASPAAEPISYTFAFNGISLTASPIILQARLIRFFGTGGSPSPTQDTLLGSITLDTSYNATLFNVQFNYDNTGSIIGTNNDDYVQIALRFPVDSAFNAQLTDFVLSPGAQTLTIFPTTTDAEFIAPSTAGGLPVPDFSGFDAYLPVLNTPSGQTYDSSRIGTIKAAIYKPSYSTANSFPELYCDGSSYIYNNYSSIGIPYARLGNLLLANSPVSNIPMFGTGVTYATAYAYSTATQIRITTNSAGTGVSNAASGTTVGWTFSNTTTAKLANGYNAYNSTANTILVASATAGIPSAAPNPVLTGFTITVTGGVTGITPYNIYSFTILTVNGSSLANPGGTAKYFTFRNAAAQDYYVWYQFTDETDPGLTYSPIKIFLPAPAASYTAQDIANVTREALNAYTITTLNVNTVAAGQYFTFNTNPPANTAYYVWYSVNNSGADPSPGGTGIKVSLSSSDATDPTAVALATLQAINKYQYSVPNLQGMFLRGLDPNSIWDLDAAQRWSTITGLTGANLGTFEFQQFLSHAHTNTVSIGNNTTPIRGMLQDGTTYPASGGAADAFNPSITVNINNSGGNETRPVNTGVNFYIYY